MRLIRAKCPETATVDSKVLAVLARREIAEQEAALADWDRVISGMGPARSEISDRAACRPGECS